MTGAGPEPGANDPPAGPGGLTPAALHFRLSAYYAGFYGVLGAMLPYFALWLAARDLSPSQIGIVLGVHGALRILLPVGWGWVADLWGRRMRLIRLATLLSLLGFMAVPLAADFRSILLAVVVFSVFWNATMPQFEAVTLNHLSASGGDYSQVRLWGSVGFVIAVLGLGWLFDLASIDWLPWIMLGLIALMLVTALSVPEAGPHPEADRADGTSLLSRLRQPSVLALLAVCFLSQLSFAPYYGFFSLYLEHYGYNRTQTGLLWAFGVVIEIWVFLYTGRLIQRYGARRMMLLAMASTVLRWALLVPAIDWLPGLLVLQALHLSSFGIYHACAIHYIHREFPGRLQGRGQALYVSASFGLGGALGAWLAGLIWEWQSPDAIFVWAAAAALAGTVIAWRGLARD